MHQMQMQMQTRTQAEMCDDATMAFWSCGSDSDASAFDDAQIFDPDAPAYSDFLASEFPTLPPSTSSSCAVPANPNATGDGFPYDSFAMDTLDLFEHAAPCGPAADMADMAAMWDIFQSVLGHNVVPLPAPSGESVRGPGDGAEPLVVQGRAEGADGERVGLAIDTAGMAEEMQALLSGCAV